MTDKQRHDFTLWYNLGCLGVPEAVADSIRAVVAELAVQAEEIRLLRKQVGELPQKARRRALLDASTEVAGHWNDRAAMCNQYDQAQRSAAALQRMAIDGAETENRP